MPHGNLTAQTAEGGLTKNLGDKAHILVNTAKFTVKHSYPCRLLAPVLEGKEAEVGQFSHFLLRGKNPKHSTGFLWLIRHISTPAVTPSVSWLTIGLGPCTLVFAPMHPWRDRPQKNQRIQGRTKATGPLQDGRII